MIIDSVLPPFRSVTIAIFVPAILLSCIQNPTVDSLPADTGKFSAITSKDPYFKPRAAEQFAWYGEPIVADKHSITKVTPQARQFIKHSIEAQLQAKGFGITTLPSQADYLVSAAIILDKSGSNQELNAFVSAFPGLGTSMNYQEEGMLMVLITRPGSTRNSPILWRGVIQAYVVGEELSPQMRESRLRAYITHLMSSIPAVSD